MWIAEFVVPFVPGAAHPSSKTAPLQSHSWLVTRKKVWEGGWVVDGPSVVKRIMH